ncbi:MAG: mechanosensitive ion channel [Bacteroidetes bacterium]|nr:mechanosensitive ion channel [Bacteroidota bacterium]
MDKMQKYYDILEREFMLYSPKIGLAILVFIIGNWVTNYITKLIMKAMVSRGFDISLQSFLGSMVSVSLKIVLLITVAGMLGLQTTSFVAVIGAAGLAVGLALQGSLANFAGGVLTLVFKPYIVGDIIDSLGMNGEVKEIQIFNTILLTPDGKTVILPNGAVSNSTIINYSKHHSLRVDIKFTISDSTDFAQLKAALLETCAASK